MSEMSSKGKVIPLARAGQTAPCDRCGDLCKVAATRNTEAQMLRAADRPKGNCVNCAVAEWFVVSGLRETTDPQSLLSPAVHKPFEAVMRHARSDASATEIRWDRVVQNWSLPFVVGYTPTGKPKKKSFPVFDMEQWVDRLHRTGRGAPGEGYADATFSDRLAEHLRSSPKNDAN